MVPVVAMTRIPAVVRNSPLRWAFPETTDGRMRAQELQRV
jgi:hypothetical protein